MDIQAIKRASIKKLLSPLLSWPPIAAPVDGFTIVLGTPWALRHLLEVNLRFVERTDLRQLDRLIVVFDRIQQPQAEKFTLSVVSRFRHLPLEFHFQPYLAGSVIRCANQSKFYASLNWVTGIKYCRTKYAIMHDFDLYPTDPSMFTAIVAAMRERNLRFSGVEYTHFDGLTDADRLIGTWELGIDVQWLRATYRPVDCFHAVAPVNGRRVDLDAFSLIQSRTDGRGLPDTMGRHAFAHVTNLCSTFLRFSKGEKVAISWRLHYLWYLEYLCGQTSNFLAALEAMRTSKGAAIMVGDRLIDFGGTHPTCANVLRDELSRMEATLHGSCRAEVQAYVDQFSQFLNRVASLSPAVL